MKSVWFCVALAGAAALAACSGNDSPAVAPPTSPRAASAPQPESPDLRKRIEIAEVGYTTSHPALALSGKVAYGEDRYSKISSPLQGRILEVRARLGDYVKPGDVLLVIDSPEITAVYSDYVKEASELEYATRAYELAKDLYETKALPQKDLKQAENDLVKARAEFRRAKERLVSLRVPAAELEKPLAQQRITSRFELKSPLAGTVVDRAVTPGQSSVRKGAAGRPDPLTRLWAGLSAQAKRTATGAGTSSHSSTTCPPSRRAAAQWKTRSGPASAKPAGDPPSVVRSPSAWSSSTVTREPSTRIERKVGPREATSSP